MKIEAPNPLRQNRPSSRTRHRHAGGGFADTLARLDAAQGSTVSLTGATPSGTIHTILAVQGLDEHHGERRRQAAARGHDLLDILEDLRQHLLGGTVPKDILDRLSVVVATNRASIDDPDLTAVLNEIDLRAQVELAKLGRSSDSSTDN